MNRIELLSPARNLECGIAAIDHGADAVYIGAPRYGARSAAGNSIDDIARLCDYAHQYGARIDVTVNTILFDSELVDMHQMTWELYRAGVDALIVQDMAFLEMDLPPIALHASTQMDNRTPEKARWLQSLGFEQIVLARELSIDQIRQIHQAVSNVKLEAFVHGALCVSFSGQCYASQYCFGRSANRGECAQFCRLRFSLKNARGEEISHDRYLLSLRDMNRSSSLEQMMDAGVRSFKIEGRLKDISYVKNVTAYYRQRIDDILQRRPEYVRSSLGHETYTFKPDPQRSFNRGFTEYFLHGRTPDITSPQSPKSVGQPVGEVKEVRRDCIVVSGTASFSNGDGLCFIDSEGRLQGFRVNRVENNHLYPAQMPQIRPRTPLFRNFDQQWERLLSRQSSMRKVYVDWKLSEIESGFSLTIIREDGVQATESFPFEHQLARTDQKHGIQEQLSRLGDTIYETRHIDIYFTQLWFIPHSILAEWKRRMLLSLSSSSSESDSLSTPCLSELKPVVANASFLLNVSNKLSRQFYQKRGITSIEPAMEITPDSSPQSSTALMFCRHCLRYSLGFCVRNGGKHSPFVEPFYLVSQDGRRFPLEFDCKNCQMIVHHA
ncbi:MAG: U32 family peptidase [Bacteroidaceae bacterium]|nr:U32 family peptidase [Bacteroidaceae bacterium]